jgi:hypothetical protein
VKRIWQILGSVISIYTCVAIALVVYSRFEMTPASGAPGKMDEATLDRAVMWPVRLFVPRPKPEPRHLVKKR